MSRSGVVSEAVTVRTGNRAHWEPDGWAVFLDTSWDGRGDAVAIKGPFRVLSRGSAESLAVVEILPGAEVIWGEAVHLLRHPDNRGNGGLGYSSGPRLSESEAQAVADTPDRCHYCRTGEGTACECV